MTPAKAKFKLAASDTVSTTWAKLKRHLEERLAALRAQNDALSMDPIATAATRGRIAELKLLLSAAEQDPPPIDVS